MNTAPLEELQTIGTDTHPNGAPHAVEKFALQWGAQGVTYGTT